jgi:hypothetical protein
MSKETTEVSAEGRGVTIKELRNFLNTIPAEFDEFEMVNGEVAYLAEETYVRIDKPIVFLSIDEQTKEFVLLHQSKAEVDDIIKQASTPTSGTTETTDNGTA